MWISTRIRGMRIKSPAPEEGSPSVCYLGLSKYITRSGCLVSSDREFKNRHRGDLNRCRLTRARQSKAKENSTLDGRVGTLKTLVLLEDPGPQAFPEVCRCGGVQSWKTGLCVVNSQRLDQVSSTSTYRMGQIMALLSQTGVVVFWGVQGDRSGRPGCMSQSSS
jgi:hypothetical protein